MMQGYCPFLRLRLRFKVLRLQRLQGLLKDGVNKTDSLYREMLRLSCETERLQIRLRRRLFQGTAREMPGVSFPRGDLNVSERAGKELLEPEIYIALERHMGGDWGYIPAAEWRANNHAAQNGGRIASRYVSRNDTRFLFITEADRKTTTLRMEEEV
jgi:hypothetical protein